MARKFKGPLSLKFLRKSTTEKIFANGYFKIMGIDYENETAHSSTSSR